MGRARWQIQLAAVVSSVALSCSCTDDVEGTADGGARAPADAAVTDAGTNSVGPRPVFPIPAVPAPSERPGETPTVAPTDAGARPLQDAGELDASFRDASVSGPVGQADATSPPPRWAGRISIGPGRVDDVDWRRPVQDNDTLDVLNPARDRAQRIDVPSWVSGYLGVRSKAAAPPDAGAAQRDSGSDADFEATDHVDYYRVDLRRGDEVTLFIHPALHAGGSGPVADLDLYILDQERHELTEGGSWVQDSLGSGSTEHLVIERTGSYWIAVVREGSGSDALASARYNLLVGVPVGRAARELSAATRLTTSSDFALDRAQLQARTRGVTSAQKLLDYRVVPLTAKGATRQTARRAAARAIKALRARSDVAAVLPEIRFAPQGLAKPDDAESARLWHHHEIDLYAGWAESERSDAALGAGTVVAVVDTGVALQHPDFVNPDGSSQLTQDGYDMVSDEAAAGDGDGRDSDPTDPGDRAVAGGGTFHGTHCAGNIAAATGNQIGIFGVAPRTRVMPVRVMGHGGGTLDDVVQGVLYAAGLENDTGQLPERRADIINLSLAGAGTSPLLAAAIAEARAAGVIVIAAAGNYDSPVEQYTPAAEPGVVTVSAIDASGHLAWYSNYATTEGAIQLSAVGGDSLVDDNLDGHADGVFSLLYRDRGETLYGEIEGTSMAAAQVSGVAALMKAAWPAMGPDEFDALLPQMVVGIGEPDDAWMFGFGLLNAPRAVAAALAAANGEGSLGPVFHVAPRALDFGQRFSVLPLSLTNVGGGDLAIESVSTPRPWFGLDPHPAEQWLRLDRSVLTDTPTVATLQLASNAGSSAVALRALAAPTGTTVDLGPVIVAMADADSGQIVQVVTTTAADDYAFTFDPPADGVYRIVFSTDTIQSGQLGAPGEWLGVLPHSGGVYCVGRVQGDWSCEAPPGAATPDLVGELDAPVPAPPRVDGLPWQLP